MHRQTKSGRRRREGVRKDASMAGIQGKHGTCDCDGGFSLLLGRAWRRGCRGEERDGTMALGVGGKTGKNKV